MRIEKITIYLLLILIFFGCDILLKKKIIVDGLWIMDDTIQMAKFLNLKKIPEGNYCLDLKISESKAYVKFINDDQIYEIDVKKLSFYEYQFIHGKKTRNAKIRVEKLGKEYKLYFHFNDSSPYTENTHYSYDGVKVKGYNSLEECIKELKEDYEFAQEEEGGLDPDEVRQKEARE